MKKLLSHISLLFVIVVFAACNKHKDSPDTPSVTLQSYITNASITDSVQKSALENFVDRLNQASLWSKFIAIYPMIGGTPNSTKWNLKDPRDEDAAFRLTFHGSPAFADTGVLFPTLADWADTHFADNRLPYNNNAISYYSTTQNDSSGYDIGCSDHFYPFNEFGIYHGSDATEWFGYHALAVMPPVTKGLFILTSTSSDVKRYDNGVLAGSYGAAPKKAYTNLPILIGNVATDTLCGQRVCALATIGYGLSDQDVSTFYQIARAFEADLKRN